METQSRPEMPQIRETSVATSTSDVSELLQGATAADQPVIPFGGGTSLHTGNITDWSFAGLDMRGLSGVREYHPTDLTASFWAGTTLAEVQAVLGEQGQELPVDMVFPDEATIGGMVATGYAGPRRLGSGTLKDLIIGCEYVRGDGLAAKAGGMLVKNVSGFEIPRFLHGSWGALAVVTAINVKVVPKPKADVSFVHSEHSLRASLDGQRRILQEHPGVMAVVSEKTPDGWSMSVRLMGRQSSIDAQLAAFRSELGTDTDIHEGATVWTEYNERWASPDGSARLVVSGRSATLEALALELDAVPGMAGMSVSLGIGTLRLAIDPSSVSRDEVTRRLGANAITWFVESAPAGWRGSESVWGAPRDDRALVQSIKTRFDPANVLNRGRLFI